MEKLEVTVKEPLFLSEQLQKLDFFAGAITKMIKNKDVRINGERVKSDVVLNSGDKLTLFFTPDMRQTIEICFQDENVIIANKPFGIEIEGKDGFGEKLNALPVHRLDRNTTGLVILAKNKEAQTILLEAIKNRSIVKKYLAEVVGKVDYKNYTFNAFLVKDNKTSFVKIYEKRVPRSCEISTTFNTLSSNPSSSLIECTLHTGKTHQIRASLAYLGHPIIGDGKYGKNEDNKKFKEHKQRLHAYYIGLSGLKEKLSYLNGKTFSVKAPFVK